MKKHKGKAIYQPEGKAAEYSQWACNFYVGCSNGCTYCYLKKGRGAKVLGGDKPTLKKCFKNGEHAISVFCKELEENIKELQKHGLFFTFTSDPMLGQVQALTFTAMKICTTANVPVKLLTKSGLAEIIIFDGYCNLVRIEKRKIAIGYTLTGHDESEPFAAPNLERIEAMKFAKENGFKTFASIEPIIDFQSSKEMISKAMPYCDLFKIGLESGKKYNKYDAQEFISNIIIIAEANNVKVYFKDSLLKCAGYEREPLNYDCCVDRDYNIFES